MLAVVEVGLEGHRVLPDVFEHVPGNSVQATFRVPHRRRRVTVDAAEVALPVHQGVAQGKVLRHANHGFVDGRITVRVVFPHHLAHGPGGLRVLLLVRITAFEHAVEDAAVHGLQTVASVRQRTTDDDGHGVIDVRRPHFFGEASVFQLAHRGRGFVVLVLRCQGWSPPLRGSR